MTPTETTFHAALTAALDALTAQGYGDQLAGVRADLAALAPPETPAAAAPVAAKGGKSAAAVLPA